MASEPILSTWPKSEAGFSSELWHIGWVGRPTSLREGRGERNAIY